MTDFHKEGTGHYEGDPEDTEALKKILSDSHHLACHQVNNIHVCIARELIALSPIEDNKAQTMVIPMELFVYITNLISEELIKDVLKRAEEYTNKRNAAKTN